MAILSTIECEKCGQQKTVSHSAGGGPPRVCGECRQNEANAARTEHLNNIAQLPVEARLALIESQLYDRAREVHHSPWDLIG